MRHYPVLRPATPRFQRLFELRKQKDVQDLLQDAGEDVGTLRPDVALALRDRAIRSLRTVEPYQTTLE
ncbi:MAG TPA: hypothetical protein VJ906_09455 [Roseovarius sp.]|uniref:hypothetical protein n=1 Tax=Marivita sp. TaxID=2003365 RepID=UPI0025C00C52|nr:hypothetical protein [Marivita sp.]HKL46455.1 hypothetical protein [Roseovarius sp.]